VITAKPGCSQTGVRLWPPDLSANRRALADSCALRTSARKV
jgi:hypothetical protein